MRAIDWGSTGLLLAFIAVRLRRRSAGIPDFLVVAFYVLAMPLAVAINIRQGEGFSIAGRFDSREEVPLPADLVERVRAQLAEEELGDAVDSLRSELDLGLGDAFVALAVIRESDR